MNVERRKQIHEVFKQALSQPPESLKSFLDEACAGDEEFRREVETSLKMAETTSSKPLKRSLEENPAGVASRFLRKDLPELKPGSSFASYRIEGLEGRGGMGIVYRAYDEKLRRRVAIKVMDTGFTVDDEARHRFLTEARALAQLSHPNILTIYDINRANDIDFIAMEWVEGKTLNQLIPRAGMNHDEALKYAIQVADALAQAHAKGIIHRDFKPSNAMVTAAGSVKLLDFGLAALLEPPPGDLHAAGMVSTEEGRILGTAAYMSPEQAQGRKVDCRSDIFSFGSVLYEMLAGRRAFPGDSANSLMTAILKEEPAPLGEMVPANLRTVVARCLRKDPNRRFQSMADVKLELEEIKEPFRLQGMTPATGERPKRRWAMVALLLAALCALGASAFLLVPWFHPSPASRFETSQVTSTAGWEGSPAISPDGSRIAYSSDESGNLDIYVCDIHGSSRNRLTYEPADDTDPAWFPDGSAIAFTSTRGGRTAIWKTPALGGGAHLLVEDAIDPAVSPDHTRIAFARMSPAGYRIGVAPLSNLSDVKIVTAGTGESVNAQSPAWSPDSSQICYVSRQELWIIDASGGRARRVTNDGNDKAGPAWSAETGQIYYSCFSGGAQAIWRVSPRGGTPERVTNGTEREDNPSIPGDGKLLVHAADSTDRQLAILDGKTGARNMLPGHESVMPSISPDGSKVVFLSMRPGSDQDLWIQPMREGKPSAPSYRLIELEGVQSHPAFSPDGRWIACYRVLGNTRDIWIIPVSGGRPVQFTREPSSTQNPAWSPDGTMIAFTARSSSGSELWVAPVRDGSPAGPGRKLAAARFSARSPAWSPDGATIAYVDTEQDESEVWLADARGGTDSRRLTNGAFARRVLWDTGGEDLIVSGTWGKDRVVLRRVSLKSGVVSPYAPEVDFGGSKSWGIFDISRDGRWLVFSSENVSGHVWLLKALKGSF